MPNDLADVAMAITDRYGPSVARSYLSGRAFTAPREHVALNTLPKPLVPTQAPLQPRKSSLRKNPTNKDDNTEANADWEARALSRLGRANSGLKRRASSRRGLKSHSEMLKELVALKE